MITIEDRFGIIQKVLMLGFETKIENLGASRAQ
jgi:hypothetical protein